jgi:small subunit ribosomal protein S17
MNKMAEKKKTTKKKTGTKPKEETKVVETSQDKKGSIKTRGKTFKGVVVSKHPKRIAIEFERMVYVKKYERYAKTKTKVHARLPDAMEKEVQIGDLVKIQECRPLSKIIHFMVIEKLNSSEEKK